MGGPVFLIDPSRKLRGWGLVKPLWRKGFSGCGFVVSVYDSFVGMAVLRRLKARCWSSVGLVSISKVGMSV